MSYKTSLYDASELFKDLNIKEGFRVLDLSKGSHGYFTFYLAKLVGEKGNVWSLDNNEKNIENIDSLAKLYKHYNVKAVKADIEQLESLYLDHSSFDVVLLANLLSEIKKQNKLLSDIYALLKKDAHLFVLDWKDNSHPIAPNNVIGKNTLKNILEQHYFVHKELDAGPYHYAFIARKE